MQTVHLISSCPAHCRRWQLAQDPQPHFDGGIATGRKTGARTACQLGPKPDSFGPLRLSMTHAPAASKVRCAESNERLLSYVRVRTIETSSNHQPAKRCDRFAEHGCNQCINCVTRCDLRIEISLVRRPLRVLCAFILGRPIDSLAPRTCLAGTRTTVDTTACVAHIPVDRAIRLG